MWEEEEKLDNLDEITFFINNRVPKDESKLSWLTQPVGSWEEARGALEETMETH